jgi:hypothetical protein
MSACLHISKEYEGRYVALKSEADPVVVGSGTTPDEALREAQQKGIDHPIFLFIPEEDSVLIY